MRGAVLRGQLRVRRQLGGHLPHHADGLHPADGRVQHRAAQVEHRRERGAVGQPRRGLHHGRHTVVTAVGDGQQAARRAAEFAGQQLAIVVGDGPGHDARVVPGDGSPMTHHPRTTCPRGAVPGLVVGRLRRGGRRRARRAPARARRTRCRRASRTAAGDGPRRRCSPGRTGRACGPAVRRAAVPGPAGWRPPAPARRAARDSSRSGNATDSATAQSTSPRMRDLPGQRRLRQQAAAGHRRASGAATGAPGDPGRRRRRARCRVARPTGRDVPDRACRVGGRRDHPQRSPGTRASHASWVPGGAAAADSSIGQDPAVYRGKASSPR